MWRDNCKFHVDFRLLEGLVPLTPMFFKGQLYTPKN